MRDFSKEQKILENVRTMERTLEHLLAKAYERFGFEHDAHHSPSEVTASPEPSMANMSMGAGR